MSIADKLTTIAENVPKVYEAGQKSMVDESKIIPKTVTGKRYVYVDDVSEIPHDVTISTTGDCNIIVYGKNLFNYDTHVLGCINGGSVNSSNGNYDTSDYIKVTEGVTYTANSCRYISLYDSDKKHITVVNTGTSAVYTYTIPTGATYLRFSYTKGKTDTQLEVGTASTRIESYVEPSEYTVQNGTAIIQSKCPCMTVITDSDVDITMNYRKSYGIQTEYDRFWDSYQQNGNRKKYQFGFAGDSWTNSTFNPKYSIVLSGGYPYAMFWMSGISGDLEEICEEKGITIDFTGALNMNYCFSQANSLKSVGFVDVSSAEKTVMQTFGYNSGIETIRVFKVREEQTYSTPFVNCTSLKNITIEGVIGNNFPINQSPLTHESIMSIINHLGTYTTTKTLTLGSTNLAKLTDAEKAIATEKGWTLA